MLTKGKQRERERESGNWKVIDMEGWSEEGEEWKAISVVLPFGVESSLFWHRGFDGLFRMKILLYVCTCVVPRCTYMSYCLLLGEGKKRLYFQHLSLEMDVLATENMKTKTDWGFICFELNGWRRFFFPLTILSTKTPLTSDSQKNCKGSTWRYR